MFMILHIDIDTFFASAHRTLDKSLNSKAILVGGRGDPYMFSKKPQKNKKYIRLNEGAFVPTLFSSQNDNANYFNDGDKIRGIVTTASYEARAYGVKTAMSLSQALQLCPHAILIKPDYKLYHELSHKMISLIKKEIAIVEQYSIDEVFADLSGWIKDEDAYVFAKMIKQKIKDELDLPVSIGISSDKWIAKVATGDAKPYGVIEVKKDKIYDYMENKKVNSFPGVGRAYSKKFDQVKIKTIGEAIDAKDLMFSWGRGGKDLYAKFCGESKEKVSTTRVRKGIGISRNFEKKVMDRVEFFRRVTILIRHLSHSIITQNVNPTTFYFKIGYERVQSVGKQYTTYRLFSEDFFQEFAKDKFLELDTFKNEPINSVTISTTKFLEQNHKEFNILHFDDDQKKRKLFEAISHSRDKHGLDIIRKASELLS